MKCPLCGCSFREEEARAGCRGCPLSRGCKMACCPNCGYEIPIEPPLMRKIRAWRRRYVGAKRKGRGAA